MKLYTIKKYILFALMINTFVSCKQVSVETNLEDTYVEFFPHYASAGYANIINYNFSYLPDAVQDTIWLDIKTRGLISSTLRHIVIEPVRENLLPENYIHADAGLHFLPFNHPDLKQFYVLKADSTNGKIPIILLRHNDMKTKTVQLSLELVASSDLQPGVIQYKRVKILINDGLTRPASWNNTILGNYGKAKHDFLIRATGKRFDEPFLFKLIGDAGLQNYYKVALPQLLEQENSRRKALGLTELRENPNDPYSKVEFPK